MIKGVHTMFYSTQPEALRAFIRDKLGFPFTDVGGGWLIFDLPEADMSCHPADRSVRRNTSATSSAPSTANAYSENVNDDAITRRTAYESGSALPWRRFASARFAGDTGVVGLSWIIGGQRLVQARQFQFGAFLFNLSAHTHGGAPSLAQPLCAPHGRAALGPLRPTASPAQCGRSGTIVAPARKGGSG